jgi:ATP-dependent DNA helicase Rep
LIKLLTVPGRSSLTVVGDDDQSIYRFRGAAGNQVFSMFRQHFGDLCSAVTLSINYRSTRSILLGAKGVVERNPFREEKSLVPSNHAQAGEPITLAAFMTVDEEIEYVASEIIKSKRPPGQFAVLCRVRKNILSQFASVFRRKGIPCSFAARPLGDSGFPGEGAVQRSDLLAYLGVIASPDVDRYVEKIINKPRRNIGSSCLEYLKQMARSKAVSLFACMEWLAKNEFPHLPSKNPRKPNKKVQQHIQDFVLYIRYLQKKVRQNMSAVDLLIRIMRDIDYKMEEDFEADETDGQNGVSLAERIASVMDVAEFSSMSDGIMRLRFILDHLS